MACSDCDNAPFCEYLHDTTKYNGKAIPFRQLKVSPRHWPTLHPRTYSFFSQAESTPGSGKVTKQNKNEFLGPNDTLLTSGNDCRPTRFPILFISFCFRRSWSTLTRVLLRHMPVSRSSTHV
jgi:hypothetical protein